MKSTPNTYRSEPWLTVVLGAACLIFLFATNSSAGPSGSGEELYRYYCAQCHGEKGDGKGINATEDLPTAPKDFTSEKTLPVFSDKQIVNTIVHGGPAEQLSFIMPSWGDILSDKEIELLNEYLRKICACSFDPGAAAKTNAEKK